MLKYFKSDSIVIKLTAGDANAGNGGDGYNDGNITNNPTMNLTTFNKVEGADVHTNTGDKVHQDADWKAEAGKATAKWHDKHEGSVQSNGDQESEHHGDNSSGNVDANTTATQTNMVSADQSQHVWAGIGGDGGSDNKAYGGDIDIDLGHIPHLV
jgi:hypothetical protein